MEEPESTKSIRILLVDDHPLVRKAIIRSLSDNEGFRFTEASTIQDARALCIDERFDLILLDLYLYGEYGGELIRVVRALPLFNDTPIMVVSGESNSEDMVRVLALGANDFLLKPFKDADLKKKILALLKKHLTPDPYNHAKSNAEKCIAQKNYPKAIQYLEVCKKHKPKSIYPRYLEAVAEEQAGHTEDAMEIYEECLRRESDFYFARAAIVRLALLRNDMSSVQHHLETELVQNPQQPDKQVFLAKLYLEHNAPEKAKKHLSEALKSDSRYLSALLAMVETMAMMKNLDKAVYYCKRIRRYFKDNLDCLVRMVKICENFGKPEVAENALRDEITKNSTALDAYVLLAKLYSKQNKFDLSFSTLDKAVQINPYHYMTLKFLFALYKNQGQTARISNHFNIDPVKFDNKTIATVVKIMKDLGYNEESYLFLFKHLEKWPDKERIQKEFLKWSIGNHEYGKTHYLAKVIGIPMEKSSNLKNAFEMLKQRRNRSGKVEAA